MPSRQRRLIHLVGELVRDLGPGGLLVRAAGAVGDLLVGAAVEVLAALLGDEVEGYTHVTVSGVLESRESRVEVSGSLPLSP